MAVNNVFENAFKDINLDDVFHTVFSFFTDGLNFLDNLNLQSLIISDPRTNYDFQPTLFLKDIAVDVSGLPFLVIEDSNNNTVFDTFVSGPFFDTTQNNRRTLQWKNGTAETPRYLTAVFDAQTLQDAAGTEAEDVGLKLPPRSLAVAPPHVHNVNLAGETSGTGSLEIEGGYNVRSEVETGLTGGQGFNEIRLDVEAGFGKGLEPSDCSDVSDIVRSINGVQANDEGDFSLTTSSCYWINFPINKNHELELRNDCISCVSCGDFDVLYERLEKVYKRALNLSTQLQDAKNRLIEQIEAVEALKLELDKPTGVSVATRTGDRQYEIGFRIWIGERTFDQATLSAALTTSDVDIELAAFTSKKKLPNRIMVLEEPAPGLSGKTFTIIEGFDYQPYEFALWQSAFIFSSTEIEGNTSANIDWSINLRAADGGSDLTFSGSHAISLNLPDLPVT